MPNIVIPSFFIGSINIPNNQNTEIAQRVSHYIDRYEKDCLIKILGYALYKMFITTTSTARMTDLLNGKEFTDEYGKLKKWEGLLHDTNLSLLANYIYFLFQRDSATQTTGVNTSIIYTESAVMVSPEDKMMAAWNSFSESVAIMCQFLWINKAVYPEFTCMDYKNSINFSRSINKYSI